MQFGDRSAESLGAAWVGAARATSRESNPGGQSLALIASPYLDRMVDKLSACPWGAHAGMSPWGVDYRTRADDAVVHRKEPTKSSKADRRPLYTSAEKARRDSTPWTLVQGILAPLQFAICAASFLLIARYLLTGQGYELATGSILLKTVALYAIMITGSIWEKEVFGKWLFAAAFFWEDAVSMLVLALQTTYVVALLNGWGTPAEQMTIAIAAYVAYAVNASQFLLKLRAARLQAGHDRAAASRVASA